LTFQADREVNMEIKVSQDDAKGKDGSAQRGMFFGTIRLDIVRPPPGGDARLT